MAAAVITWKEAGARESGDGGGGDDGREVRFSCGDGREVPKDGQGMRRWRQRTWFWPMALAVAVTAAGKREEAATAEGMVAIAACVAATAEQQGHRR